MEPLAEQEIATANLRLSLHVEAASKASFFLGVSALSAIAVPSIVLFLWSIGSSSAYEVATSGGVLAVGWLVYGAWWYTRSRQAFTELRRSCLKLRRAGFVVFMKKGFPSHVLAAIPDSEAKDVEALEFERLTSKQLRASMQ